jgi:dihydrofolate reductase
MDRKQPKIILISALAESNRAIGKDGKLPWPYIPEDSNRFQELTKGHPVIMGRKTWEYDLEKTPLVERSNVVISSKTQNFEHRHSDRKRPFEIAFVSSFREALKKANNADRQLVNTDYTYIIGGAVIYEQALEMADIWELTIVEGEFNGDTFFPEYQHLIGTKFEKVNVEKRPGFRFETYKRIAA